MNAKQELSNLSKTNMCSIIWVPGHSGIEGNEQADLLANAATIVEWVGQEPCLPVSICMIKRELHSSIDDEIVNQWSELDQCKHTKQIISVLNVRFDTSIINFNRQDITSIMAVLTGHGPFKAHLAKLKLADETDCPKCGQELDTSEHYITLCPYYKEARLRTFGQQTLKGAAKPNSINVSQLLRFIKLSQRFTQDAK